jgi:hypothetical protein
MGRHWTRLERVHARLASIVYRRPSYARTASRRLLQACRAHDRVSGTGRGRRAWNLTLADGLWCTPDGAVAR